MLVYSRLIEVRVQRRVVITGMGTVSPNGVGNPSFSQAVLEGRSGVRRISRFDASEIAVQIAGEVTDFNELAWVDRRERKHVSRVLPLALAAATDALGYAMRQIQSGRLDMVLSGGADAPIALGIVKGFLLMKILTDSWNHAPERASRPFSVDRDGFVLAEGAWMFVLEEYEHARARGAKILAEICGYGSTCEAFHRVRLQECGEEPARAIYLAMKQAGIGSGDVDYVNLHGTSTQLNDRIESRALKLVLGERAREVPMSALKSQIGHPQGACGAAGIAATILAMQRGRNPPAIKPEKTHPGSDFEYVPEAGRKKGIEHAVCNCIAFGSKNSAVVLRKVA